MRLSLSLLLFFFFLSVSFNARAYGGPDAHAFDALKDKGSENVSDGSDWVPPKDDSKSTDAKPDLNFTDLSTPDKLQAAAVNVDNAINITRKNQTALGKKMGGENDYLLHEKYRLAQSGCEDASDSSGFAVKCRGADNKAQMNEVTANLNNIKQSEKTLASYQEENQKHTEQLATLASANETLTRTKVSMERESLIQNQLLKAMANNQIAILQMDKLEAKDLSINEKLNQIERVYDKSTMGAYVADKVGRLLNSHVMCEVIKHRCEKEEPYPIKKSSLHEIFQDMDENNMREGTDHRTKNKYNDQNSSATH